MSLEPVTRPSSYAQVDPALRRPGRLDREFYFPLPDAAARLKGIAGHHRRCTC